MHIEGRKIPDATVMARSASHIREPANTSMYKKEFHIDNMALLAEYCPELLQNMIYI